MVTTGDLDGIGLEVTLKALCDLPTTFKDRVTVYCGHTTPKFLTRLEAQARKRFSPDRLTFVRSPLSPVEWVESATRLCLLGEADALVTAPLSKETIRASGRKHIGHTDILKDLSGAKSVYMTFLGQHFNVLLATGHIPIRSVSSSLTPTRLKSAIQAAVDLRAQLPKALRAKPIAVVGLNPHAGENGLIGKEEAHVLAPALRHFRRQNVVGPLVPDAAFLKSEWSRYSLYVCPYHDQGLIPFKLTHGHDEGVHLSFGLPFVRTSVDHGTAKNIFGKNKARSGSMKDALLWAAELARKERPYGL